MKPALITFDIFGTVLDWRRGLEEACSAVGHSLGPDEFDRVIDAQGRDEQAPPFKSYREIVARSLVAELELEPATADRIGSEAGCWPLFADSREGLRRLAAIAPLGATTNSDRAHREQVQAQLASPLRHWFCAEDLGCYKPDLHFFWRAGAKLGRLFGRDWWHVSAYADYDLRAAHSLGLTTVFVERQHARRGEADVVVPDLLALAELAVG